MYYCCLPFPFPSLNPFAKVVLASSILDLVLGGFFWSDKETLLPYLLAKVKIAGTVVYYTTAY